MSRDSARQLPCFEHMYLQSCKACEYLLEKVAVTSTLNLGVRLLLEMTVKNLPDAPEIPSLQLLKSSCEMEYRQAVDQYRIHQLTHDKERVLENEPELSGSGRWLF